MTAPRFAAALSEHPVASHAVGEVAGEVLDAFGGDEPDLLVLFVSPHFVGAIDDLTFALAEPARTAGDARRHRGGRASAGCPRGRGRARGRRLRGLVSRRHPHAGRARRGTHARRRRGHRLARPRRRSVDPAAARRSVQLPARRLPRPPARRPSRPPGDRRRGVGGARSGRQPPGARRPRRHRPARSASSSTACPCARWCRRGVGRSAAPYVVTRGEGNRDLRARGPLRHRPRAGHARPSAARGGPRAPARRSAPRHRGRRAPGRLRARRLPRAQRARRRPRHRRASRSATTSTVGQTVQFHVRDADAADEDLRDAARRRGRPAARCCSRATAAAAASSASPTTTPRVVDRAARSAAAGRHVLRRRDRPRRRAAPSSTGSPPASRCSRAVRAAQRSWARVPERAAKRPRMAKAH